MIQMLTDAFGHCLAEDDYVALASGGELRCAKVKRIRKTPGGFGIKYVYACEKSVRTKTVYYSARGTTGPVKVVDATVVTPHPELYHRIERFISENKL
jgi:hypothetical protein